MPTRTRQSTQNSEEPEFLVDGLIREGSTALLHGDAKAGKSTLTRNLAASVATGDPFLGRFAVKRSPVLALWLDESWFTIRNHFERLGWPDDLHLLDADAIVDPVLGDGEWLEAAIREVGARLLILDLAPDWLSGASEEYRDGSRDTWGYLATRAALLSLRAVAQSTGCAVLSTFHNRKSGGQHGKGIMGSGAGQLGGVDAFLSLTVWATKQGDVVTLEAKGRDDVTLAQTETQYSADTGRVVAVVETDAQAEALAMQADGVKVPEIMKRLGVSRATVYRYLQPLSRR